MIRTLILLRFNFLSSPELILFDCFLNFRNPNSHDLKFEWRSTRTEEPKYLSLDGDNTRMVDGLLNGSRVRFWENIRNS